MHSLKNKRVLVMGLGLLGGGCAVTQWLYSKGAKITVTDLKTQRELKKSIKALPKKNITWHLGGHKKEDFCKTDLIIQNPDVQSTSPFLEIARKKKIPIYNEASLFFLIAKRPIIAVTGTRGKSTTSTLIYEMLKNRYPKVILAGNRGDVPMLSFTQRAQKKTKDPIVLELSSWQVRGLEAVKMSPHIALLTNLYPDHLNRYSSLGEYYNDKSLLFAYQKKNDIAIFNLDNNPSHALAKKAKAKISWFTTTGSFQKNHEGVFKRGNALFYKKGDHIKRMVDLLDISLTGSHNEENIAAAVTVARKSGVSIHDIHTTLRTFNGIWGRQQNLGIRRGIRFINDTTASTPIGLAAFINTYPESIIIVGGVNKNLSYTSCVKKFTKDKIKALILIPGSATEAIVKELKRKPTTSRPPIYKCVTLKKGFAKAVTLAKKGDTVALSPGASSFNLFINEFDRGKQFEKLVAQF